jgi:putative transposase
MHRKTSKPTKKRKPRYELQPGNEIRGYRIRIYPDQATKEKLHVLERDLRRAWNWLVNMTGYDSNNDASRAKQAYAVREGLIGPRPCAPNYHGMSPDEAKKAKDAHYEACGAWHHELHEVTKDLPGCQPRKLKDLQEHFGCEYDYQLLKRVIGWAYEDRDVERTIEPGAHLLQALTINFFTKSDRCKKFRRARDAMPIQVRSGACLELGDFGGRRGQEHTFYHCRIAINGLLIRGRLRLPGRAPEGRVLQGVSLIREADGWWASIKQEVPIRIPPPAVSGSVIGLDVGLDYIVAMSDGNRVRNTRAKEYAERIAGRQAQGKDVSRMQLAEKRHNLHLIYNKIVKPLAETETIKIEKLSGRIGQMGSAKTSSMRTIARILTERYGDRVREVEPHYTSQDCSQCGHRSKESWSYDHGRYGQCPQCGYREDRDVNAARNIAAKCVIPFAASSDESK